MSVASKPIPARVAKAIGRFLATRSRSDGGFAPVGKDDIQDLYRVMEAIFEAKYERDPDGDLPINIVLVDRTQYEPVHHMLIPYRHLIERGEGDVAALLDDRLDRILTNLRTCSESASTEMKMREMDRMAIAVEEAKKLSKKI